MKKQSQILQHNGPEDAQDALQPPPEDKDDLVEDDDEEMEDDDDDDIVWEKEAGDEDPDAS